MKHSDKIEYIKQNRHKTVKQIAADLVLVGSRIGFHISAGKITSVFLVEHKDHIGIPSRVHLIVRLKALAVKRGTPGGGCTAP